MVNLGTLQNGHWVIKGWLA